LPPPRQGSPRPRPRPPSTGARLLSGNAGRTRACCPFAIIFIWELCESSARLRQRALSRQTFRALCGDAFPTPHLSPPRSQRTQSNSLPDSAPSAFSAVEPPLRAFPSGATWQRHCLPRIPLCLCVSVVHPVRSPAVRQRGPLAPSAFSALSAVMPSPRPFFTAETAEDAEQLLARLRALRVLRGGTSPARLSFRFDMAKALPAPDSSVSLCLCGSPGPIPGSASAWPRGFTPKAPRRGAGFVPLRPLRLLRALCGDAFPTPFFHRRDRRGRRATPCPTPRPPRSPRSPR
jgi:hypothetical protein